MDGDRPACLAWSCFGHLVPRGPISSGLRPPRGIPSLDGDERINAHPTPFGLPAVFHAIQRTFS